MQKYLSECLIPIEIYRYDAAAPDDLYETFKRKFTQMTDARIANASGLRINIVRKIRETMEWQGQINSISQLALVKGIGLKSLEKSFRYIMDSPDQKELIDHSG